MTCQYLRIPAILLLVVIAAGCPKSRPASTSPRQDGKSVTGEPSAEDLLKSAIHQLRPENYTIAAATDKPINLLNSWRGMTSPDAEVATVDVPAGWIDDAELARLKVLNYDLRDAIHVRDAMLSHTIAEFIVARGGDEIAHVQGVVDYVVRNLSLRGSDETDMPLGIYQLLLIGRGTVEDRAWLLATLLRQIRVDSVIVRPAGADNETWLFGAILNGRVYLYDLRIGIAIPSSADLSKAGPPATLDEIPDHPEWLQPLALRSDQPYGIEADSLKNAAIFPIGESVYWSQRMKNLEAVLPSEEVCVLYDPLNDDGTRTGLLSRLTQVKPNWKREDLKLWAYPLQQFNATRSVTKPMTQALEAATMPFNLPIPINIDPKGAVEIGVPERKLLKIRTDHLLGKFDDATKRYLGIRHLGVEEMPVQNLAILNQQGAEHAIYWTGVCKFEMGDYDSAIEQLSTYVKRYDRSGRWNFAARSLLAECYAQKGNFKEAVTTIERTRSDDPNRGANAFRVKRWNAQKPN